jgi:NitT/TauT family transport system substrate-binding protein
MGVNIELVSFPTRKEAAKAFSEGKLDAVHEDIVTTLVEASKTGPLRKVLTATDFCKSAGIVAQGAIKTVADLKGKTVGVEPETEEQYMLLRVVEKAGLKASDVKMESCTYEEGIEALAKKKLAALVASEPNLSAAERKIKGKIIYRASIEENPAVGVFVVSEKALAERAPYVIKAMKVYLNAVDQWEKKPADAQKIMAEAQGVTPLEFQAAINRRQVLRSRDAVRNFQLGELETAMQNCKNALLRAKVLTKEVEVMQLIDQPVLLQAAGVLK